MLGIPTDVRRQTCLNNLMSSDVKSKMKMPVSELSENRGLSLQLKYNFIYLGANLKPYHTRLDLYTPKPYQAGFIFRMSNDGN